MFTGRIKPADWLKLLPALESCSVATLNIAEAVLVNGKRPADLARELGKSPQTINASVKRVRKMIEPFNMDGLVNVNVWLPPELAAKVEEMVKAYKK